MSYDLKRHLPGITSSLLLPLYIRARETQRPNGLIKDEYALELINRLGVDSTDFSRADISEEVQVSILLRSRQFDRISGDYLNNHPEAAVVYIGCGMDARFERVDNGKVEWFDLDLPEVISLRGELMPSKCGRHHLLADSVLDFSWMDEVSSVKSRPFLFMAEGVFMFFSGDQVRRLVLKLKEIFPNSELVFDAFSPFYVWGNNRRVKRTGIGSITEWALRSGKELETWDKGISLISSWYPFLCPEPRLAHIRWARFIPILAKTTGVFHYKLG